MTGRRALRDMSFSPGVTAMGEHCTLTARMCVVGPFDPNAKTVPVSQLPVASSHMTG